MRPLSGAFTRPPAPAAGLDVDGTAGEAGAVGATVREKRGAGGPYRN
jgi:hypothetical protein